MSRICVECSLCPFGCIQLYAFQTPSTQPNSHALHSSPWWQCVLLVLILITEVLKHWELLLTFTYITWKCYITSLISHIWPPNNDNKTYLSNIWTFQRFFFKYYALRLTLLLNILTWTNCSSGISLMILTHKWCFWRDSTTIFCHSQLIYSSDLISTLNLTWYHFEP